MGSIISDFIIYLFQKILFTIFCRDKQRDDTNMKENHDHEDGVLPVNSKYFYDVG